jgi:DNA-binding IclR family transcriptional regulator
LLRAIRRTGATGTSLRDLYRNLNLSAKRARQLAYDLVKAGLVAERQFQGAEWFVAVEFLNQSSE